MRRIIWVLAVVLLASSCSSGSSEEPSAIALVSDEVFDALDAAELEMVDFEAGWMCDAQRLASPDLGVVDSVRAEALANSDMTAETYEAFKRSLDERVDLREAVLARFIEICQAP